MADAEPGPFAGLSISSPARRFEIVVHDLTVSRRWSRTTALGDVPEFSSSIHGRAVSDFDYVRVLDTQLRSNEFNFTLSSDIHVAEAWERLKRIDLLVKKLGNEPERIRSLQHDIFDKSPPTAAVFCHESHWAMECEIPLLPLNQLISDVVAGLARTIRFEIDWPLAFVDKETNDWGFFKESQLKGHVLSTYYFCDDRLNVGK